MPVFWLGLMLMGIFAVQFKLAGLPYLPTGGMYDLATGPSFAGLLRHLVLPSVTLAAALIARYVRYARASMLEVIHQDYMRTARAKGLRESVLLRRHGFKNAAIPIVSLIGVDLPLLLSGTVVTESIFGWPGMGRLFFEHSLQVDVPVLMGVLIVSSSMVILGSLLADIAYAWIEPADPGPVGYVNTAQAAAALRGARSGAPGSGRPSAPTGSHGGASSATAWRSWPGPS